MANGAFAGPDLDPDEPTNPDDPVPGGRGGVPPRSVPASGDQGIDGLLSGVAWDSNTITYSFPTSASDYGSSQGTGPDEYPDPAPFDNFATLTTQQEVDVERAFALISSYTQLTFTPITETPTTHATIRFANSSAPPTAYAYYPSVDITGGDVFFGGTGEAPVIGNFDSGNAVLHEIGHALGLKHGQESDVYGQVPANLLDNEYSLMNYPAYVGAPSGGNSTIGPGSSPQTYMMYDIASLQYMYGANFDNVGISQVYTWSPTTGEEFINGVSQGTPFNNHIFSTVWTGGSNATYNLSNFAQNSTLDLRPGGFLRFSDPQLADLGYYSSDGPGTHMAQGNVYNALLYNGDTRSEVSGLITGNGNDVVFGNDVFDTIALGSGMDTVQAGSGGGMFDAGSGADTFFGGSGADYFNLGNFDAPQLVEGGGGNNVAIFSGKFDTYTPAFNNGTITIATNAMPSAVATLTDVQTLQFADVTIPSSSLACFVAGTRIGTERGDVPVEKLRIGDRALVVVGGTSRPVIWIRYRRVDCARHPDPVRVWPVRITAGAFGPGRPSRDTFLSPEHAVFVDDVLIPVKYLINGTTIAQVKRKSVSYYHVELADHDVLLANHLPAESYLDTGDRSSFANGGGVIALYPDFAARTWEAKGCAPLIVTGAPLAAARSFVNALAVRRDGECYAKDASLIG